MAWLHVEIRGRQCKSHRMINYMKYENCDTIDSTKKGLWLNPYAIYLDSIFSQRAKDYRKSPLLSAFKSKLSFIFLWIFDRKKILNKRKNEQTQCRVCIFLQNIWQIKRKRRHINSSKIIDPFENNRQIRHQPTKFCQRPFFTRPKLFHIRTFCCWCCSWGGKTKKSHNYDAIHCQIVHELDNWYGQLTQLHAKQTKCRNISKHLSHCLNAGQKCAKKSD